MAQGRAPIIWAGAVMVIAATVLVASGRGPLPVFLVLTTLLITFLLIRESLQEVEAKPAEVDTKNALPIGFGRAMLERMPSALFVITRRGRVTYANQAALELLSNLRIGDHFANLFRAPDFVDAVNLALMEGESRQVSFTVLQDTKRYYEARVGLLPEGSDFGDSVHAIVQIEDRTTDKRAEDMRSDFIANASHELRTPLASILGYIETLRGHAKDDPEAREQFLEIMQKQAQRMQRLVEDLMSLSRIEMNEHVRPSTRCSINEIVADVVGSLRPLEDKHGVKIDLQIDQPFEVLGDRDQISQVFTNLIDNAMKYGAGAGPVTIKLQKDNPRFPGRIGVAVSDNGAGISREHLHRLTERFYRVSVAQSRNKGGTGLGLAIVKHIINRHGGALDIQSTLGKGSTFTVWLEPLPDSVTKNASAQLEVS